MLGQFDVVDIRGRESLVGLMMQIESPIPPKTPDPLKIIQSSSTGGLTSPAQIIQVESLAFTLPSL